jgi:hypothetical protein
MAPATAPSWPVFWLKVPISSAVRAEIDWSVWSA